MTAARVRKKLILHRIFLWDHFINMKEEKFKVMFERKFRIKLIRLLRDFFNDPVYLKRRRPVPQRRAVSFKGNKVIVCKR